MELLCRVEEELDALLAQIAWANDCIENLQEEIVEFEDIKVCINFLIYMYIKE